MIFILMQLVEYLPVIIKPKPTGGYVLPDLSLKVFQQLLSTIVNLVMPSAIKESDLISFLALDGSEIGSQSTMDQT